MIAMPCIKNLGAQSFAFMLFLFTALAFPALFYRCGSVKYITAMNNNATISLDTLIFTDS